MRYHHAFLAIALFAVAAAPTRAQVNLADYRLVGKPIAIEGLTEDASGVTVCEETGTLFVVVNGATSILELTLSGAVKRTIELRGFEDTEDLLWLRGTTFAVIEERRRNLCFFEVTPETTAVPYEKAIRHLIDDVPAGNKGIEGIAYDPKADRYLIVKEKMPRRIYGVQVSAAALPTMTTPWDIEEQPLGMRDLSSIYFDPSSGHLLILSDESKCVVECTVEGEEVSRMSLAAGRAGLDQEIPQPEGVALDAKGRLYVCSEPNLLYIFERSEAE